MRYVLPTLGFSLFVCSFISIAAPIDAAAQERIPVTSIEVLKADFLSHDPVQSVVYEILPSTVVNNDGKNVHDIDLDGGTFWEFDPGEGITLTIHLPLNSLFQPSGSGQIFQINSGALELFGPEDALPEQYPVFTGFQFSGPGAIASVESADAQLSIRRVGFSENSVTGVAGSGGALAASGGRVWLDYTYFHENHASQNGGGISGSGDSQWRIGNSWFFDNRAEDFGGNIHFAGDTFQLSGTFLANGYAGDRGGNLDLTGGSTVTIRKIVSTNGFGALGGDGIHISTDPTAKFSFRSNLIIGASNCNPLRVAYPPNSDVSYNLVSNNGGPYTGAIFSTDPMGVQHANLFGSLNGSCPREFSGGADTRYNVEASQSSCVPLGEGDIKVRSFVSIRGNWDISYLFATGEDDIEAVYKELADGFSDWLDTDSLQDRVPTYVWSQIDLPPYAVHSSENKTQGEVPAVTDNCPLVDVTGLARPQDGNEDGTVACDAGPYEAQHGADLTYGQSGAFFDINRDGEGIFVQMLGDGRAVVYVFTYTPDREQMWLIGVGEVAGNSIYLPDLLLPSGPVFGPGYDPADLVFDDWGRASVHWPACGATGASKGVMTFAPGDDAFEDLRVYSERLTNPVACEGGVQHDNAGWSGNYYLPAEDGHGIVVEILPNGAVVMIWYLFDDVGKPRWILGVGTLDGNTVQIDDIELPVGGIWGNTYNPADISRGNWGDASLTFTCSGLTVQYDGVQGSRTLEMTKLIALAGTNCVD